MKEAVLKMHGEPGHLVAAALQSAEGRILDTPDTLLGFWRDRQRETSICDCGQACGHGWEGRGGRSAFGLLLPDA